ncbi:non-ribosomal peptide synthetase, partial [Bradyrhizobium liaoningense]
MLWQTPDTFVTLLQRRAERHPDRIGCTFLKDGETEEASLTYAEIDDLARAVGAQLASEAASGSRVILAYPPGLHFLIAFLGCLYAGHVAVPVPWIRTGGRALARFDGVIRDCEPAIIATTTAGASLIAELAAEARITLLATDPIKADTSASWRPGYVGPEALALLQYTSGTTAAAKGVMLTHRNLIENQRGIAQAFGHGDNEVVVGWLPHFHDMGLIGNLLHPLYLGGRSISMAPLAFLHRPSRWLKAISTYGATTSGGPDFAYAVCARAASGQDWPQFDLSSWRVAFCGAERVNARTLENFSNVFSSRGFRRAALHPCFGLAEATLMVSAGGHSAGYPTRRESGRILVGCGVAIPGHRIEIVDPLTRRPLPDGETGEVWVSGPSVAAGYWNRPEETEVSVRAKLAGSDSAHFLRTGDLAIRDHGQLFPIGRIKDTLIVAGRSISTEDLTPAVKASHPLLNNGGTAIFAIDDDDGDGEKIIVVQEVERGTPSFEHEEAAAAIRAVLAVEHGVTPHGIVFARGGSLPRTSSGKIRQAACRELYRGGGLKVLAVSALRSPAPAQLVVDVLGYMRGHIARKLGVAETSVPVDRPVAATGLDSLAVTALKHALERDLQLDISLTTLMTARSLVDAAIAAERTAGVVAASGAPEGDYPANSMQRAIHYSEAVRPGPAYLISRAASIAGPLDIEVFKKAIGILMNRHSVLRSSFHADDGKLTQHVHAALPSPVVVIDAAGWAQADLLSNIAREAERPIDLSSGPPLRIVLYRKTSERWTVLAVFHHIAVDLWSLEILARQLHRILAGQALQPTPPQSVNFAGRAEAMDQDEVDDAWRRVRERILPAPPELALAPGNRAPGRVCTLALDSGATNELDALAKSNGTTVSTVLLTALVVLLQRVSDQEEIGLGMVFARREQAQWAGAVGCFVNTLPICVRGGGDLQLPLALARIARQVGAAVGTGALPFEEVVRRLRLEKVASRPFEQVLFAFEGHGAGSDLSAFTFEAEDVEITAGPLQLAPIAIGAGDAQADLTIIAGLAGGRVRIRLQHAADIDGRRILKQYCSLLRGFVQHPNLPMNALPIGDEEDLQFALQAAKGRVVTRDGRNVGDIISGQASQTPDAVAMVWKDGQMSYAELFRRAAGVASSLCAAGVVADEIVALDAFRGPDTIVGLLGILFAGGAYLPIDPEEPKARQEALLTRAGARVAVTSRRRLAAWQSRKLFVVCAEGDPGTANPPRSSQAVLPGQLAYLLFTSGSTGTPKGVQIEHRGLINRLLWMQETYGLRPHDVVLHKTSLTFDVSAWEVLWPLVAGAVLALADPGAERDPELLANCITRHTVTHAHFVPSMLNAFVDAVGSGQCGSLRCIIVSGDTLSATVRDRVLAALPVELHNLYGPTEASIDVTAARCDSSDGKRVSIGTPIANTDVFVLQNDGSLAPVGVPGHLYIGGVGLARGYLRDPALTAKCFIPNPFASEPGARMYVSGDRARLATDGCLEFLGRVDDQTKIAGRRVEPGEVEAVILECPGVREVAVLVTGSPDRRLIAYVAGTVETSRLRNDLRDRLPPALIPSRILVLAKLPRLPSGKVDRKSLQQSGAASEQLNPPVRPVTEDERALASIWEQLLSVSPIGIHDRFFDLGGDSIRSIELVARSRPAGFGFTASDVLTHPTIAQLALFRFRGGAADVAGLPQFSLVAPHDRPLLPDGIEDSYPLCRLQEGLLFHSMMESRYEVYVTTVHLNGVFDLERLRSAAAYMVRRHPLLRTSCDRHSYSRPLQLVHRSAVLDVTVSDLTEGQEAQEMRRWTASERYNEFDWARAPLARLHVHRRTDGTWYLSITEPFFDGWSISLFFSELLSHYATTKGSPAFEQPPLGCGFNDFVARERVAAESAEHALFWTDLLQGAPFERFPRERAADVARQVRRVDVAISDAASTRLPQLASRFGVPLKSLLLAIHIRVLQEMFGADVVTGVITHGRLESEGGDRVLGPHLNTIPLRVSRPQSTWQGLARQVLDAEALVWPFRRFPYADLLRLTGGRPPFDAAFNFTHFRPYALLADVEGIKVLDGDATEQTYFPLTAQFNVDHSSGRLTLSLDCDAGILTSAQIEGIGDLYANAVRQAAADDGGLPALGLHSSGLRHGLLVEWSGGQASEFEFSSVADLVVAAASRDGGAVAVCDEWAELSYAELDGLSNALGSRLRASGVGCETRVALVMERSRWLAVSALAVLKAGGAFVALDPWQPQERVNWQIADAGAVVVLTDEAARRRLQLEAGQLLSVDRLGLAGTGPAVSSAVVPDQLAYVIYTSGTTGRPKGVGVPHRGLTNLVRWHVRRYGLNAGDVSGHVAGLGFDASVWELWPVLAAGGRLEMADAQARSTAEGLRDWLVARGVTTTFVPTGLAEEVLRGPRPEGLRLRRMLVGGERLYEAGGEWGIEVINHYGPTEASVVATAGRVKAGERQPSIGRPIDGMRVRVLADGGGVVGPGVAGELYIGGAGLARGYLGRAAETALRFVPDPFGNGERLYRTGDRVKWGWDGRLHYLGRADDQVKIRGQRVEPGELEGMLRSHPAVREAAAVSVGEGGATQLLAYVVSGAGERELQGWLAERVAAALLPARIVGLEHLPRSANGKVDRDWLRRQPLPETAEPSAPPVGELEHMLVKLWASVLGRSDFGRHDNFFALGGDSLRA